MPAALKAAKLARALFRFRICGCGSAFAFFDKLFNFLATFLSDAFVEVGTVAIARGFATFLSTLLTDLLVEFVTVSLFRCKPTFPTNLLVELRAVLFLDGFAAFLAGFADRHTGRLFRGFWGRHYAFLSTFSHCPGRTAIILHILERKFESNGWG